MAQVFLSHSHSERQLARRLAADLRKEGHIVWVDEAEIKIGDSLIEKIREGIDSVDYVAALLSKTSVESEWVKKELDIASNREIEEKRVVVLPLLVDDVKLPGFIKGKFYGDLRNKKKYSETLAALLRQLGPSQKLPKIEAVEINRLNNELKLAKAALVKHAVEIERARAAAFQAKSPELQAAILAANNKFPGHAPINTTYAFQLAGMPITLDYLLWCIAKAQQRGVPHQIEYLLTLENMWGEANRMLEAYSDLLASERRGKKVAKIRSKRVRPTLGDIK